ncbi:hypothetical protein Tcan_02704, partial [Toxocara canis]
YVRLRVRRLFRIAAGAVVDCEVSLLSQLGAVLPMNSHSESDRNGSKEEPSSKALWITHVSKTMKLMARMAHNELVGLDLPLCEDFKARVLRVDATMCRICVSPVVTADYRKKLTVALAQLDSTDEAQLEPTEVTLRIVYLVRGTAPFRGVVTKVVEPTECWTVFDIDSGMIMPVDNGRIVELPDALCEIPPLVICIAVPPCAVDPNSADYISEDSIVTCRFNSKDLLLFVDDTYPPVLVCEVQSERDTANENQNNGYEDSESAISFSSDHSRRCDSYGSGALSSKKSISVQENSLTSIATGDMNCGLATPQSAFEPYRVVLPYRLTACVCNRVVGSVYWMRDSTLLETLYEHIIEPIRNLTMDDLVGHEGSVGCIALVSRLPKSETHKANRCRLYRGAVVGVDQTEQTCSVYLVDYAQTVRCSLSAIFDITEQSSEVRRLPSASFAVRVKGADTKRKSRNRIVALLNEEEYSLQLTVQEKDGCFVGTICVPTEKPGRSSRGGRCRESRRRAKKVKQKAAAQAAPVKETKGEASLEQKREEMRKELEDLAERENALRRERELLEAARSKRDQDIALMTMQLQIANISRKVDAIASCSMPNATFGSGGYAMLHAALQLNSNYALPLRYGLQQPNQNAIRSWLEANNELLTAIQRTQGLQAQQGGASGGAGGLYPLLPSHTTPLNTPASAPVNPMPHPSGSADRSSAAPTLTASNGFSMTQHQDESASEMVLNSTDYKGPANVEHAIFGDTRPVRVKEESTSRSSTVSVVGSPSFGRISSFAQTSKRSQSISLNASPDSGLLSSTYANRPGGFGSRNRSTTEYGEPPKHLISEYERSLSKKNATCERNLYKSRPSCTICQAEGHFANSCPSNIMSQAGGDNADVSDDVTVQKSGLINMERNAESAKTKRVDDSQVCDTALSAVVDSAYDGATNSNRKWRHSVFNYTSYVEHVGVEDGRDYVVKRSDGDDGNARWPLFFVQVGRDAQLDFIEEHLDSLESQCGLRDNELVVGTVCASYCAAFEGTFRAVITRIDEGGQIEVHYIDYGNYEMVGRSQLKSLDGQVYRFCSIFVSRFYFEKAG